MTCITRPHPKKKHDSHAPFTKDGRLPCSCYCYDTPHTSTKERTLLGPLAYNQESWSRLGPMGPLLDPKLYPAKVSSAPESQVARFNQPNVFLQKLNEKYPFIYECLRTAPPDDLISRINKERLRTTYQVDYCKLREYPNAPYEELLNAAGVDGIASSTEPVALPGDICRMYQKSKDSDYSSKIGRSGKISKSKGVVQFCEPKRPCWRKDPANVIMVRPLMPICNQYLQGFMPPKKKKEKYETGGILFTMRPSPKCSDQVTVKWGKMIYRKIPCPSRIRRKPCGVGK